MTPTTDIAGILQEYLEGFGYITVCTPYQNEVVPGEPLVGIAALGGSRYQFFRDDMNVAFDIHADTWAEAMEVACDLVGVVTDLEGGELDGRPVYSVEVVSLPYENPDPTNPPVARVTFTILISIRTEER